MRLYAELISRAEESAYEAEQLPSDIRDFRSEIARLVVETYTLNSEIELLQDDVRTLGEEVIAVAEDIEDFRFIIRQVLDTIAATR